LNPPEPGPEASLGLFTSETVLEMLNSYSGRPLGRSKQRCLITNMHEKNITCKHHQFSRLLTILPLLICMMASGSLAQGAPENFVPGQILVKPAENINQEAILALFAAQGAVEIDAIHPINVRVLQVPEVALERVLAALSRNPAIEFAERNLIAPPGATPDDPIYPEQWHLPMIESSRAWTKTLGNSKVIIAILDTGVNSNHVDLAANMVPGWNFYDNNSDTRDVHGHGTAVAGSAAAQGNNTEGVASVAWNCKIMPIRISDPQGYAAVSTMAKGLTYAADQGARVANISYRVSTSSTIKTAAKYMYDRGGAVAIAAGNQGEFDPSPNNPYVLTVSATTANDKITSWSNTGNLIDLAAPGSAIYTTLRGGGYGKKSGTSFSAPIVAGVAGLVISANPNLSGEQIQEVLKMSADDLGPAGWDPTFGWGRVNAGRAVETALSYATVDTTPPVVKFITPSDKSSVSEIFSIEIAATDNDSVALIELYLNNVLVANTTKNPAIILWDTTLYENGSHQLQAKAYDPSGNSGASSITVNVLNAGDPVDALPPSVAILSPRDGDSVLRNVKVHVAAESEAGIQRVELYINGVLFGSSTSTSPTFTWNLNKYPNGQYILAAAAYDNVGNAAFSLPVTVRK
jgi:thermitase